MKKLIRLFQAACMSAVMAASSVTAFAMEVPISEVCQEVNGQQVLTRVFSVAPEFDPENLIAADFEKNGFVYTFDSIVKEEKEFSDIKRVTKAYEFESDTKDLSENIRKLPPVVKYEDEEGYEGELHLEPRSVSTDVTGYHTSSYVVKSVIDYPDLAYNDPTLVPGTTTKNGSTLPLTNISWTEGDYMQDSSIPETYNAQATYKKTMYKKVADGYCVSAEYFGEAQQNGIEVIDYTVTYVGNPIHHSIFEGLFSKDGQSSTQMQDPNSAPHHVQIWLMIIGGLLGILLCALIIWLICKVIKSILGMFVVVQAQDDTTGEYKTTQRVRMSKKNPVIELNTMKTPGSRHYSIKIPKKKAEAMMGKVITVHSAQQTFQHQVGDAHGMDYTFSIDFVPEELPNPPGRPPAR